MNADSALPPAGAAVPTPPPAPQPVPPPAARARNARFVRYGVAIAGCTLLAAGAWFAWLHWFAAGNPADSVITATVARGNLEDTVTATGTLQPKDFVDVGTQVSGQLKNLLVDVGAVVTKGQLLAEIDPSVYQAKVDGDHAQLLNQTAQLADKQAQLALAELQLTRQQNLTRDEATTADALQNAEATRKSALAQVDSLKAQIQQTGSTLRGDEANLGYTKIYAPIAGTVVSQAAKRGQTLNANQQAPIVMRIADLSTMTVQAQVSEADVPKLRIGMDVYFTTLGGDNRRFYGKLRQIPPTPTVVNNVVLYDALFDVPNPDQVLMTQMTAQVFFVAASAQNAVLVPLTALRPLPREGRTRGSRAAGADDAKSSGPDKRVRNQAADADAKTPATDTAAGSPGADKEVKGPAADKEARKPATDKGGARKGGGERATGTDPRSLFANGRALVSVVDANGKITEREVKVGVMNRVSAQILSGLEPGEKVVIGTKAAAAPVARAQTGSSLVPAAKGGGRP